MQADQRAAARVYYDGTCPLCRREIEHYRRMAGADAVDWHDVTRGPPPDGLDREEVLRRFTVRRRDGALASGAAGFAALWRALGPLARWGRLVDRPAVLVPGEALYRGFLGVRRLWRRP